MDTDTKMSELKIAAWNAHSAEIAAAESRDDAWEVYIEAAEVFNTAKAFSEKAAKAANDYEANDYEAADYNPEG